MNKQTFIIILIILLFICIIFFRKKELSNKNYKDMNTNNPKSTNIYLVGDSVLDNFYWLKHPDQNITSQLRKNIDYANVYNYSIDKSTTTDIIKGSVPDNKFINARKKYNFQSYLQNKDDKVYPLKLLKHSIKDQNKRHIAVLSVGGNDGRAFLPYLLLGYKNALDKLKETGFNKNYQNTVKAVKNITPETVLVLVYKPHNHKIIPQFLYDRLLKMFNEATKIIYKTAQEERLPLIDLTKTMDYNDSTHYGTGEEWSSSPIEPSAKAGLFITKLIKHVIENHDFKGESKVYYGSDVIKSF